MSLPISAPVPEEYAKEFDAENPSTYGDNVVFSGPYMVENNAEGELTGYTSGREIQMVRNPNWDADSISSPRTSTRSGPGRVRRSGLGIAQGAER